MKDLIILFLVFGGIFAIVPSLALLYGLDMKVDNPNCKEEVNGVKKNKLAIIISYSIGIILMLTSAILFII